MVSRSGERGEGVRKRERREEEVAEEKEEKEEKEGKSRRRMNVVGRQCQWSSILI